MRNHNEFLKTGKHLHFRPICSRESNDRWYTIYLVLFKLQLYNILVVEILYFP